VPEAGSWYERLNSEDTGFGGSGPINNCGAIISENLAYDGYGQSIVIDLAAMALVVFQYAPDPTSIEDSDSPVPVNDLENSFPNPFNPSTTISFSLAEKGQVSLQIFDVSGRLVKTLIQRELSAGEHSLRWDGTGRDGEEVTSGVYFCRMKAGGYTATRRLVLLR
jgi:hypothetical protein